MTVGKLRSLTANPAALACGWVRFLLPDGTELFAAAVSVPEGGRHPPGSGDLSGKPVTPPGLDIHLEYAHAGS